MQKISIALVSATLSHSLKKGFSDDDEDIVQTAKVLCRKINAMPFVLRTAMAVLTHAFNAYGLVRAGQLFQAQGPAQRRRQMDQWRASPLGPCREMVVFYEKMAVFIYFSL